MQVAVTGGEASRIIEVIIMITRKHGCQELSKEEKSPHCRKNLLDFLLPLLLRYIKHVGLCRILHNVRKIQLHSRNLPGRVSTYLVKLFNQMIKTERFSFPNSQLPGKPTPQELGSLGFEWFIGSRGLRNCLRTDFSLESYQTVSNRYVPNVT